MKKINVVLELELEDDCNTEEVIHSIKLESGLVETNLDDDPIISYSVKSFEDHELIWEPSKRSLEG